MAVHGGAHPDAIIAACGRVQPAATLPPPACGLRLQELEARINKVIEDYKEKLQLRTDHHMG